MQQCVNKPIRCGGEVECLIPPDLRFTGQNF
jgi:hypothetical protein